MSCGTSPLLTFIHQCKARWQHFLERFRDDSLIYWTFWICALALYGVLISPDNDLFGFFLFGVFRPTRELFTHMRRHHDRVRAAFFLLILGTHGYSSIEQWGFFDVPHLLWRGTTVYNGHLWGSMTLTPVAEHLAVEL